MGAHQVRAELQLYNNERLISTTLNDGNLPDINDWGAHFVINETATGGNITGVDPIQAGQRIEFSVMEKGAGSDVVIVFPSSIDDAAAKPKLTFSADDQWAVLESFKVNGGTYEWRVTAKAAAVTIDA